MVLLQENQVGKVVETNRATAQYGLALTEEEAKLSRPFLLPVTFYFLYQIRISESLDLLRRILLR